MMGKVWNTFHKLRFKPKLQVMWATYQTAIHNPPSLQGKGKPLLQLLLDQVLKCFTAAEASECSTAIVLDQHVTQTPQEQIVIRYMAGYVVKKMKMRFKQRSKQPEIQKKRQLFLHVLSAMESKDQDGAMPSFQSNCDWVKMIDREGLCHVNENTYLIMQSIEFETRHYLRPDGAQQAPCQSVQKQPASWPTKPYYLAGTAWYLLCFQQMRNVA